MRDRSRAIPRDSAASSANRRALPLTSPIRDRVSSRLSRGKDSCSFVGGRARREGLEMRACRHCCGVLGDGGGTWFTGLARIHATVEQLHLGLDVRLELARKLLLDGKWRNVRLVEVRNCLLHCARALALLIKRMHSAQVHACSARSAD